MPTRNISLTDAMDRYVEERVSAGAFQNASEMLRAGLRLLQQQEDDRAARLAALRAAIQPGLDELKRGEGLEVGWDELDVWMSSLGRGVQET